MDIMTVDTVMSTHGIHHTTAHLMSPSSPATAIHLLLTHYRNSSVRHLNLFAPNGCLKLRDRILVGGAVQANSFCTTVGSRALTVGQVVVVAEVMEFSGAMLLSASVTAAIKSGVVRLSALTASPGMHMLRPLECKIAV